MYIYIIIEEKSTSGTLPTNRRNIYVKSFTHTFNILLIATLLNDTHVRNNGNAIYHDKQFHEHHERPFYFILAVSLAQHYVLQHEIMIHEYPNTISTMSTYLTSQFRN
jgi:hypothetical protein